MEIISKNNRVFKAKLIAEDIAASDVKRFTFHLEEPFLFDPWQYVWVEIQDLQYPDIHGNRRAFSIFNTKNVSNNIEIIARQSESGYKKNLFSLNVGAEVIIHGPFGSSFTIDGNNNRDIFMIAGGTGIVSFIKLIKTIRNYSNPQKCFLYYINSSPDSTPFLSELLELKNQNNFFDYLVLYRHLTTADIEEHIVNLRNNPRWMISGPQDMVDHSYNLLSNYGVDRQNLEFENFYPTNADSLTFSQIQSQLKENNIFFQALENSTNHTIITDTNGIVLYANKAAQNITGFTSEEMYGNTPRLWGGMMEPEFYQKLWKKKKEGKNFDTEILNRRKNGETYTAIAHISPIKNSSNNVIGFIGTEEDITSRITFETEIVKKNAEYSDQKQAMLNVLEDIQDEKNLTKSINKKLELAKQSAKMGIWEWDIQTDTYSWDDRMYKLFGIEKNESVVNRKTWTKSIDPKDFDSRNSVIQDALDGAYYFTISFKIIWPNNSTHYIQEYGIVETDENKNPIKVIGSNFDITREKEIDRMKTEFISLASHQLRTPISAIKWFSEMLLDGDAGELNEEQAAFTRNISESNERMIKLVSSLLNISRIESGRLIVSPKPTDLTAVVKSVIQEIIPEVETKKQKLTLIIDPKIPIINIDPDLISEVYSDLISNASKYSNENGKIEINISIKDDKVISQVVDSGCGIPEKDKPRIFEKFFRSDKGVKLSTEGNGLGLYLIKAIVEVSGGKIWFESVEDKGSKFYFTLPTKGSQAQPGEVTLTR